jgi:flagellar M-ring protein FliF
MSIISMDTTKFNGATTRARQFLAGFTPGQKAVTVIAGLGLVIAGVLFVSRSSSPSYTTLYSNLQPAQAGQVTQALTTAHVPYQLEDNGATIAVPQTDVNQERINLAEAGLPSGGTVTFQTLASTGITSSEFVQNVDYQQALEGQLESTIDSIQGIESAQVSLAMPSTTNSSFAIGNTQTTTASVLVDLTGGTTLAASQVQGIVNLVASSVPGLTASNVTVVDNGGDVLSAPGASASASTDSAQTTAYDNQLGTSLTALVAQVVGTGNAAVQVHALLNFNQQKTTTNGFEAGKNGKPITAPTSSNTTKTSYTGNGAQAAGVLSAGTPTGNSGTSSATGNGTYTSTQTQTQTAVGSVTQTVDQAPGQVTKTAVAVLVNSSAVKRSEIPSIKSLVLTAAGLNPKAGDSIVVDALPFSKSAQLARASSPTPLSKIEADAPTIAIVALILLLFSLAIRNAKRGRPSFQEIPMQPLTAGRSAYDPETQELPVVDRLRPTALASKATPVTSEVETFISSSPGEITDLMRNWSQEPPALRPEG